MKDYTKEEKITGKKQTKIAKIRISQIKPKYFQIDGKRENEKNANISIREAIALPNVLKLVWEPGMFGHVTNRVSWESHVTPEGIS